MFDRSVQGLFLKLPIKINRFNQECCIGIFIASETKDYVLKSESFGEEKNERRKHGQRVRDKESAEIEPANR